MVRLSALVCVHNQDAQLSDCLRSLSFCDEIVVVADRCSDRSQEIARRHGAVVVDGFLPLESQRKAAGLEACSGDWVLEVEPEEQIDSALAWEIRAALQLRPEGDCFVAPVDNYVGDTPVRRGWTGSLSAATAVRLFRPGAKRWKALRLDEGAVVEGVACGTLKGAIRRRLGRDAGGLVERLNRRAGLHAEDLADAARAGGVTGGVLAGLGEAFRSYGICGGWREGRLGLLTALLSGLYPLLARMRAREILEARRIAAEAPRRGRHRQVVGLAAR